MTETPTVSLELTLTDAVVVAQALTAQCTRLLDVVDRAGPGSTADEILEATLVVQRQVDAALRSAVGG